MHNPTGPSYYTEFQKMLMGKFQENNWTEG